MCHAFFQKKCRVQDARYCDSGWHERVQYDTKLQHEVQKSATEETNDRRPRCTLRSVDREQEKPKKRPRSEEAPIAPEEDIDTDTETLTTISLCKLGLFGGIPETDVLETVYKQQMQETQGNKQEKASKTAAFKIIYAEIQRQSTK